MGNTSGEVQGGTVAGRYHLTAPLGRGGMGRVWRARDEVLHRQVAVKEIRIDAVGHEEEAVQRERSLREARAIARIEHPNVVGVHDVLEEDERLWIVMQLVEARSLQQILDTDGPLDTAATARTGLALIAALRAVHACGVLHRDVKPGNVLVEQDGKVVLTDFGIAAIADTSGLTMAGTLIGSPGYMAPERVRGEHPAEPSDLWSLGATLCAALTGRSPFSRGNSLGTLHAVLHEEPELPADGPLVPVLAGLLRKDPDRRLSLDRTEALLAPLAAPPVQPAPGPPDPARNDPARTGSGDGGGGSAGGAGGRHSRRTVLLAALSVAAAGGLASAVVLPFRPGRGGQADGAGSPSGPGSSPLTAEAGGDKGADEGTGEDGGKNTGTDGGEDGSGEGGSDAGGSGRRQEVGFRWSPPGGWTRTPSGPAAEVHYLSPDGSIDLSAAADPKDGAGLLDQWNRHEAELRGSVAGYRKLRLERTSFRGREAVLWEYAFTDRGKDYRGRQLGFHFGQTSYQINVWYPVDAEADASAVHERAQRTFIAE
ncbi:serine/threonine-protein kinase [Streptomyces sp. 549]|uniref:serine/threonine-protein kinase n=1 Tax=Streptomyces sp. 549 TaxID=3049076 RepID=UPI0024C33C6E|nr:serine/threonine-protein kinase [Streptomyces sp. 549]MDK1474406.1 serine/threonine-protein kinase [Streptomyces sp. 549]